ncbi:MAG: CrcB family protein [Microbacteriaceae bacterium]|nr:CrcB family protein [Microbacteriaceae bacterium]
MSSTRGAATWVAVGIGGAIGTAARYGLELALPHALHQVPWATVIENTLGSFLLGVLVAATATRIPHWLRAGLGAGVLGSFTTFSTLMVAAVGMAQGGELAHGPGSIEPGAFWAAAGVLVGSLVLGVVAALLGLLLGRRAAR